MSDTVKLIIKIDKRAYKACRELRTDNDDGIVGLCAVNAIANGTPLDDVKKEIANLPTHMFEVYELKARTLHILDNIGKESKTN